MDEPVVLEAVHEELTPYLLGRGFREAVVDRHSVTFESSTVKVQVIWDPRGEIAVVIQRLDESSPHGGWQYGEITTLSSVARHLRQVVERLEDQPALLAGDTAFYDDLRRRNQERSKELTAYYAREGPRPPWMGTEPKK